MIFDHCAEKCPRFSFQKSGHPVCESMKSSSAHQVKGNISYESTHISARYYVLLSESGLAAQANNCRQTVPFCLVVDRHQV